MTRHKQRQVLVIEAEAKEVDVRAFSYFVSSNIKATMVADQENCYALRWFPFVLSFPLHLNFQLTSPSADDSEIQGQISSTTIPYDYLVYAVGAETQTFGIPGVKENACFMKELHDADKVRQQFLLPLPIYWMLWYVLDAKTIPGLYVVAPSIIAMHLIDTSIGVESAAFPGQSDDEKDRLLHMVRLDN